MGLRQVRCPKESNDIEFPPKILVFGALSFVECYRSFNVVPNNLIEIVGPLRISSLFGLILMPKKENVLWLVTICYVTLCTSIFRISFLIHIFVHQILKHIYCDSVIF